MIIVTASTTPAPPVLEVPPAVDTGAARVILIGVDGSTWDLCNGPVQLGPGLVGLAAGDVTHQLVESLVVDGATWRGSRTPSKKVSFAVVIDDPSPLGFRDLDAAFFDDALNPDGECLLVVTSPDAVSRTLPIRFVGVGDDYAYDIDPLVDLAATYPLTFIAADPYWRGATERRTFRSVAPPPFFSPSGSASVFSFAGSDTTAFASIRNAGKVPSWPLFIINGATSGVNITVGDSVVGYGPVADGRSVYLDTFPARQTVGYGRGQNSETAWTGVLARNFAPIPPGVEVPIGVTIDNPGAGASLQVELVPRHRRAW